LVLLWLAAHALLLGLILSLKFLTAKTVVLLLLAGAVCWFLLGRRKPLALSAPHGMV
jgi:hypothetical protein